VGGTIKVMGIRIATPLTDPRPGIAPTNRPIKQPNINNARLNHWSDVKTPSSNNPKVSM